MASPKETIWELEPHTAAKHLILRHYLEAWFPILSKYHNRLVYYDGFAGPGRYKQGEEGSPIVALRVAMEHSAGLDSELVFRFVEEREDRAKHLEDEIGRLDPPNNFKWKVIPGEFKTALSETLDYLDNKRLAIAPTFAFIDPFGIKGLPFSLIKRLLSRKRCEVLITFMTTPMQRFIEKLPNQVNVLIGNDNAAEQIGRLATARERSLEARQLYQESLRRVASFVRFFRMSDETGRPIYDLFFATNNAQGHYKMKEAMWKADALGEYSFCDGVDPNQITLFTPDPGCDYAPVLWRSYKGKTVYSDDVLKHTRDKTPFLEKHTRAALKLLEAKDGLKNMSIDVSNKKRDGLHRIKGAFAAGTHMTFSK